MRSHEAGFPHDLNWDQISRTGNIREQRVESVKRATSAPPLYSPGTKFEYSNVGYVVAGAMAERVMQVVSAANPNETWENLITQLVFRRLGMVSVGFGGTGTLGQIDQPWPHDADGTPLPANGPKQDNPEVMGPAGTVHASMEAWSKFIADQLRGARGERALLEPDTYRKLQTPPFGGDYALGWGVTDRDWGGGTVLTHAGSNTMNYAVVWIAPQRDFAVLAVTNQGGDIPATATDDAVGALINYYLSRQARFRGIMALFGIPHSCRQEPPRGTVLFKNEAWE